MISSTRSPRLFHNSVTPNNPESGNDKPPALVDEQCLISLSRLVEERYHERPIATTETSYGDFHVKIPFELSHYKYFFDSKKIYAGDWRAYGITDSTAVREYTEFMRQYNFALLQFYKAINGSTEAENKFKSFFQPDIMFATVSKEYLSDVVKKPNFKFCLLAYLLLDVVFSPNEGISVEAKIKAINLVKNHFSISDCSQAFREFFRGYELDCKLDGLLPSKFENFDPYFLSFDLVITLHPYEAAQILLALLKVDSWTWSHEVDKAAIFEQVIKLSNLTSVQQIKILGVEASYRNNGYSPADLRKWAVGITQIPNIESYVDLRELAVLSGQPAKEILLKYATRNYLLEKQLVALAAENEAMSAADNSDDPYALLKLSPKSHGEDFQEKLDLHYRVVSAELDVEDDKHISLKVMIVSAYEKLKQLNNSMRKKAKTDINNGYDGESEHDGAATSHVNGMRYSIRS